MRVAWIAFVVVLARVAPAAAQSGPGVEASVAYRALAAHLDRDAGTHDAASFVAGLAPQLDCWFGREHVARAQTGIRDASSAVIVELSVLREAPTDVTLLDRGWYSDANDTGRLHEKLVRLRKTGGQWLVVAESSATTTHGCRADAVTTLPPAGGRFARCQVLVPATIAHLEGECGPGNEGNGCAQAQASATSAATSCLYGVNYDWTRYTATVASLHDVAWATLPEHDRGTPHGAPTVGYGDVDHDGVEDAVVAFPGAQVWLIVVTLSKGQLVELSTAELAGGPDECHTSVDSVQVTPHAIVVAYRVAGIVTAPAGTPPSCETHPRRDTVRTTALQPLTTE